LGHLIQVTDLNDIITDVFIHYREGSKLWHGTDIHKWSNTSFGLHEIEFQGHQFFIPEKSTQYLDENYGEWSQPVLFWDYSFDTPNRDFFKHKKTVYYLAERIMNEMDKVAPSRYTIQGAIDQLKGLFDIDLTKHLAGYTNHGKSHKQAKNVVITFGTFDLFHIGHLNILERSASHGDKLVVGVSSDSMNQAKKNAQPVYCQDDRIAIVKSLECVDNVFFEESLELKREYILEHGASVLVMGEDWKGKFDYLDDICEVIYLPRTENISTSETKDSIKRNL